MSLRQTKLFPLSVLLLFALAACGGNPQEEARAKLGQMNVKYNEDSFVEAARNGDVIAVKYFLQAGMKPSVTDNKSGWRTAALPLMCRCIARTYSERLPARRIPRHPLAATGNTVFCLLPSAF